MFIVTQDSASIGEQMTFLSLRSKELTTQRLVPGADQLSRARLFQASVFSSLLHRSLLSPYSLSRMA